MRFDYTQKVSACQNMKEQKRQSMKHTICCTKSKLSRPYWNVWSIRRVNYQSWRKYSQKQFKYFQSLIIKKVPELFSNLFLNTVDSSFIQIDNDNFLSILLGEFRSCLEISYAVNFMTSSDFIDGKCIEKIWNWNVKLKVEKQ